MEHKQIFSTSSVVPRLFPKHSWRVAQNSELHDPVSYYHGQIPELLGNRIRGCFHGCWVILSSNHPLDVIWSLWNPFTSQIISLPPLIHKILEEDSDDITCCLSAPPDHPNSVLLLARSRTPNIVYCRIGGDSYFRNNACKRMKFRWAGKTFSKQVRSITGSDGSFHGLTCCNSKVYAYFIRSDSTNYSLHLVEFHIVVNDRRNKKLKEVVITLLPVLDFQCPRIVDSTSIPLLKGSCSELFTVVLGLKEKWTSTSVSAVYVFKLDINNMRWEELEDLKDTILSVEFASESSICYSPAIASSELGGYVHILSDDGKIMYSYHVKDKTISLSSIPCVAGKNHVSVWAMLESTRLKTDRVYVDCKQEKEGDKEEGILVRSVKGDHQVASHLPNFQSHALTMNKFCVGLVENNNRLESENTDSKQGAKDVNIIVEGDEDESHLLNLPTHVLEMMLMEFCVGVEYLKFRSTCKRCHLAAPLIACNNGKGSTRLREYAFLSPWLILFDKHKGIITLTDPVSGDKYFIKTPQELICDFEIKDSRYGWLLILKSDGSLVFYNPFTSDIQKLPQLDDSDIFSFSAPPTSPGCMVVGTTITIPAYYYHVCIHFVGGEPSWRRILLDVRGIHCYSYLTVFGRDLYALREDRGLDVFKEIGREDHLWKPNAAKAPTSCCTSLSQTFLLICAEHLLHVIIGRFGESVEVFKLNDSTQEWVKLDSLGKHVIFIWGTSSLCTDAKTPHMENKIYFPRLPAENENLNDMVFYSLETCRYHTSSNNNNFQESFRDFFGTKHLLVPHAWIEPTWS